MSVHRTMWEDHKKWTERGFKYYSELLESLEDKATTEYARVAGIVSAFENHLIQNESDERVYAEQIVEEELVSAEQRK